MLELLQHLPLEQVAAGKGHAECVHALLAHQPEQQVAAADVNSVTALMWATAHGHAACLVALLAHNPTQQVMAADVNAGTALTHAAMGAHDACMEALLVHQSDLQMSASGDAALVYACTASTADEEVHAAEAAAFERRRARCVRMLLHHGANPAVCGYNTRAAAIVHVEVQACLAELREWEGMPLQLRELMVELAEVGVSGARVHLSAKNAKQG